MVKYTFKLSDSYIPDLTQKKDDLYGGVKLVYKIYKSFYISIFKKELNVFNLYIGKETFLRPFKHNWDKKRYWLPKPYWGKIRHPLIRLWVVIDTHLSDKKKVIPKTDLSHQDIKLFNKKFRSHQLAKYLFSKSNKFQLLPIN